MLNSILTSESTGSLSVIGFLICILSPLVLGFVLTMVYRTYARPTKSFAVTLSTLPAIVSVIIMMVSGSLGAGVAVAGTFSLVRFRSAAGTAREIGAIFTAMAIGLACRMGYPVFALMFTAVLCGAYLLYDRIGFIWESKGSLRRTLCVTVPEDLEYGGMFDEIMQQYTSSAVLTRVKTTNLGSLNRLTYDITLKEPGTEKALIDALRCRNGNLEISMSLSDADASEL